MYVRTCTNITHMILCDCDAYQRKDLIGLVRATTCSTIRYHNFAHRIPPMYRDPDSSHHWYSSLGHLKKKLRQN